MERRNPKRWPPNRLTRLLVGVLPSVVVLLAVALGAPRPVLAHGTAGTDPTLIHACAHKNTGDVRIVQPTQNCLPPENPVHWTATGSGGPGPTGPPGPAGPQGPQGPPGGSADAGIIEGQIVSACIPGLTGTLIHLQGRSFMAKTGADGKFVLDYVPQGTYDLVIEVPGQPAHVLSGVQATNAVTNDLGALAVPDFQSHPGNCGTCGHVCQTGICAAGVCVTAQGGTCGNGEIDPGEQCDGANTGGQNCLTLLGQAGILLCSQTCTFNTSICFACPPAPNECVTSVMTAGHCGFISQPPGAPCTGGLCDGSGQCVSQ